MPSPRRSRMRRAALLPAMLAIGLGLGTRALPAAPAAQPAPRPLRVGLQQHITRLEVSCPAGLILQSAAGDTLLEGVTSLTVRVGTPPPPPANSVPPTTTPPGETPAATPGAATPGAPPANEPAVPPKPALHWLLSPSRDGKTETLPLVIPLAPLHLGAADGNTPVSAGRARYRGTLALEPQRHSTFNLINALPLEDYLRGVVPVELSATAPAEALKAQAIAARTYALNSLGRHAAAGFDLCGTIHCQVYSGATREAEACDRAIAETRDQVLLYQGKPVTTYFHACCGGATDSPSGVWGTSTSPPYLSGVTDAAPELAAQKDTEVGILLLAAQAAEAHCTGSAGFSWEFEHTREELQQVLARTLPLLTGKPAALGVLQDLVITGRTASGRAATLEVRGSQETHTIRGDSIRWLFGSGRADSQGLPSTRCLILPVPNAQDPTLPPERYRFTGVGRGHGIGMCQSGAVALARRGSTAIQILQHYYPGTEVGTLARGEQP